MQKVAMLKNMATAVAARSVKKCYPILRFTKQFHNTARLHKCDKCDTRHPVNCPKSQTDYCIPLKTKPCSQTDPPVRPCGEQDCSPKPRYTCCVSSKIEANVCEKFSKALDAIRKADTNMFMQANSKKKDSEPLIWNYPPECCSTCEYIPFDVMYYKPSNKCRDYQRTWWECCPRMVPKRVCCWCDAIPPETSRRCLPLCPRSACTEDHEYMRQDCVNKRGGCPRLTMPCCRAARIPPSCHIPDVPNECNRLKCPFPSYSECDRLEAAVLPERPLECRCLNAFFNCDAYQRQLK